MDRPAPLAAPLWSLGKTVTPQSRRKSQHAPTRRRGKAHSSCSEASSAGSFVGNSGRCAVRPHFSPPDLATEASLLAEGMTGRVCVGTGEDASVGEFPETSVNVEGDKPRHSWFQLQRNRDWTKVNVYTMTCSFHQAFANCCWRV